MLYLKSLESPKTAFGLPISRDRDLEAKMVGLQAAFRWDSGRHSCASLCQLLTEMPLSFPSLKSSKACMTEIHSSACARLRGGGGITSVPARLYSARNWTSGSI